MKRLLATAVLLASGFSLSAVAQTPAAPAGGIKIAVIAFQMAVAQTNEGQRNFADLQKKFAPREEKLKSLNEEVESLTKQVQDPASKLSDTERTAKAKSAEEKKKQLDRSAEDARNDFKQEMQEMYSGLASKVYDVMNEYVKQQGYTLVLDVSQQTSPVLYANEAINITAQVKAAYDTKSGIPAPATPAAKPAPKAPAAH